MKDPQKILYLDDIPTPYRLGVHKKLSTSSSVMYKVIFCASEEPGRNWDLEFDGLEYTILKGWQYRPKKQANPFSFKFNPGVIREIKKFRPDVVILSGYVHPTMWLASAYCRYHKIPYGITCETSSGTVSDNGSIKAWLKNRTTGPVVKGMSFGLPVSRAAGHYLKEISGREDLPVFQFPNTPDISSLFDIVDKASSAIVNKSDLRQLGVRSNGSHILFVGRLIDAKCPLDLLEAYQDLPKELKNNTHLVFVGDGPLRDEIISKTKKGDLVHVLGWIKDTALLAKLMASTDLFVLPSQHEPWGAVINEAMACGAVVIASEEVGAAKDMIEHGHNGFVFPSGNVRELSRLIATNIDAKNHDEISRSSKATAKKYGHDVAVKNLMLAVESA